MSFQPTRNLSWYGSTVGRFEISWVSFEGDDITGILLNNEPPSDVIKLPSKRYASALDKSVIILAC